MLHSRHCTWRDNENTCRTANCEGTLLLKTIGIPSARPTMDIDMLRKASLIGPARSRARLSKQKQTAQHSRKGKGIRVGSPEPMSIDWTSRKRLRPALPHSAQRKRQYGMARRLSRDHCRLNHSSRKEPSRIRWHSRNEAHFLVRLTNEPATPLGTRLSKSY